IDKAFTTKSPKEAKAAIDELHKAMDEQEKRTKGLAVATDALNARTKNFVDQLKSGSIAADQQQASFDRLGTYAVATFAGLVKNSGDVIGALQQMGPTFESLTAAQSEFGLQTSSSVQQLLGLYQVTQDNAPAVESLQLLNQMMTGF